MKNFEPKDFEEVLEKVEDQIGDLFDCDVIRSVGGNFNTRGMDYVSRHDSHKTGTIIVGEDDGAIAVDISILDGAVRSFVLEDTKDSKGMKNIVGWFEESYS